jgi:hypothetical protein
MAYPVVLKKEDADAVWNAQRKADADAMEASQKALAAERARIEEEKGLTERPDDVTVIEVLAEVFGKEAVTGEESVMHPAFQEMRWQLRLLLARRLTPEATDATGTGYITIKARAEMRAALVKLATKCREIMNQSEMSLARAEAEREIVKIEAESRKDRTPPSPDPSEQVKRWYAPLCNQSMTNFAIERLKDELQHRQNAGKPGLIEAVGFGWVKIDSDKVDVRDFKNK